MLKKVIFCFAVFRGKMVFLQKKYPLLEESIISGGCFPGKCRRVENFSLRFRPIWHTKE